jgi:hypothetical protein
MQPWGRSVAASAVAVSALALATHRAEGQGQAPPAVCQADRAFRQFDFWIGEWTVRNNADSTVVGQNRIESRESGCVLVEHWTGSAGTTGISLNYYDRVTGKWRQVWVANNYSIDIVGGLNGDGAMVLEGHLHHYRQNRASGFRGTWTPNPDGTVRQLFEQRDAETGAWQVWFDGRYERKH